MEALLDNTDLLTDILVCFPPKTLIRLKSVSKTCFSLISGPEFGITHTRRNTINSTVSGFYFQEFRKYLFISLNGRSNFSTTMSLDIVTGYGVVHHEIVHSCNGLFLLRQEYSLRLIVYNPTTQNYKVLPVTSIPPDSYITSYAYDCLLAFEPLKSHHYKVVMMSKETFHDQYGVHIFASQSGSWEEKLVTAKPGNSCTWRFFWNGAIHWVNDKNIHLQFDIESNKMIETQLPPNTGGTEIIQHFEENNGRLFLIQYSPSLQMLEMDANTHCWTIKHQVNMRSLALHFPEMNPELYSFNCRVLYVKSGDDMKSFSLVLAIPGKLVLYEVKNDKSLANTSVLCKFPYFSFTLSIFVHPFIQCLAPV